MNVVTLIGNLCTDVNLKELPGDKRVANFLLAVDRPSKDGGADFVGIAVWDKQAEFHPMDFKMYENAGEYEIKILENGKLARTAKFTMGPNGQLVDSGVGKQNNLGTGRIVLPVQITGDQDGTWDRNAYKTDAFFGSPLTGFVVP